MAFRWFVQDRKRTLFDSSLPVFSDVSAATCGNATGNGTLDEAFTWCGVDVAPGTFCTTAQQHDIPSWLVSPPVQSFTKTFASAARPSIRFRLVLFLSQSEWKESPSATGAVLHRKPIHHCRPKYCNDTDSTTKHHFRKCNFIPSEHNN